MTKSTPSLAQLAVARLDAELVQLDVPLLVAGDLAEHGVTELEQRGQGYTVVQVVEYRCEIARHAAVQRVVVDRLVMRLVGHQLRALPGAIDCVGCMPALAIAAAVGHVLVLFEVIPAVEEHRVTAHRRRRDGRQQVDRPARLDEQEVLGQQARGYCLRAETGL